MRERPGIGLQPELGRIRVADRHEAELAEARAEHGVAIGPVVGGTQRPVAGVVGLARLARADVLHQERNTREARLRLHALSGGEGVVEEAHGHGADPTGAVMIQLERRPPIAFSLMSLASMSGR